MKKNHIKNKKRHLAVVGVIFDKKRRILLAQRHEPKSTHAHLKWQFPGDGINFGEHPLDTVRREVKEEVGVEIELIIETPIICSHIFKEENIHAVVLGFPAKYKSGKINVKSDKTTGDAKWFKYEEINFSECLPQVREMLEEAKKYLN